jgi:hypothetical protein
MSSEDKRFIPRFMGIECLRSGQAYLWTSSNLAILVERQELPEEIRTHENQALIAAQPRALKAVAVRLLALMDLLTLPHLPWHLRRALEEGLLLIAAKRICIAA